MENNDRYIVEQEFEHVGYKCVVVFQSMGYRCGYVGIPKGHILYGKDYSDHLNKKMEDLEGEEIGKRGIIPLFVQVFDDSGKVRIDVYFDVHGGITYSGGGEKSEYPIESDLWWFGFDCNHAGDKRDLKLAYDKFPNERESLKRQMEIENMYPIEGDVVRSEEYVTEECKRLAEQLKEFEEG